MAIFMLSLSVTLVLYLYAFGINETERGWSINDIKNTSTTSMAETVPLIETRRGKRLPQAVIIGTRKSGTRALLKFLELNPSIRAAHSEIHFFDKPDVYKLGLEWYKDQMPESTPTEVTIEKSPAYFVTPGVPEKVKSMNTSIKLVIIFRDPVTRLISDYSQLIANKVEALDADEVEDYSANEKVSGRNTSKSETAWKKAEENFKKYVLRADGGIEEQRRAVRIGMYSIFLERWRALFPMDQFHFVSGETLISDPANELRKLEIFLGLEPTIKPSDFVFNKKKGFYCLAPKQLALDDLQNKTQTPLPKVGAKFSSSATNSSVSCLCKTKGRRHVTVSQELIVKLRKFYAPYNEYLYSLIGLNFDWPSE